MDKGTQPAFAMGYTENDNYEHRQEGVTKRELFAAMSMQGIITADGEGIDVEVAAEIAGVSVEEYSAKEHWPLVSANIAVKHADALLKALEEN